MSPASGGRMVDYFKLSNGGGLNGQLDCPPPIAVTLISVCFPRQRGQCTLHYSINIVAAKNYGIVTKVLKFAPFIQLCCLHASSQVLAVAQDRGVPNPIVVRCFYLLRKARTFFINATLLLVNEWSVCQTSYSKKALFLFFIASATDGFRWYSSNIIICF